MDALSFATDVPGAELRGSGSANFLHQAAGAGSRDSFSDADLLLPCARGYCLRRGADAPVESDSSLAPLGDGDAAVCALAQSGGAQPCIALARANRRRLELWRLGVLLEEHELPGVCRGLSWRDGELAVATAAGGAILSRAADGTSALVLLEPREPTLALAWLDGRQLALAFSEDASACCRVRLYDESRALPLRTLALGAGRVCSIVALPGEGVLVVAMTTISVTLASSDALAPLASGELSALGALAPTAAPPAAGVARAAAGPSAGGEVSEGLIDLTGLRARAAEATVGAVGASVHRQHPLFHIASLQSSSSAACAAAAAAATTVRAPTAGARAATEGAVGVGASSARLCFLRTDGADGPVPAAAPLGSELSSPNMLAATKLSVGGRTSREQWVLAVGSSVRSAVEVWTVRTAPRALAVRAHVLELPPRHCCHGLAIGRAECVVLCSRPLGSAAAFFSAQSASRALQLHGYSLALDAMVDPEEAPTVAAPPLAGEVLHAPRQRDEAAAGRRRALDALGPEMVQLLRAEAARAAGAEEDEPPAPCNSALGNHDAQDAALALLARRLRALTAAYAVEWGVAPLVSVDEDADALTVRIRLHKQI